MTLRENCFGVRGFCEDLFCFVGEDFDEPLGSLFLLPLLVFPLISVFFFLSQLLLLILLVLVEDVSKSDVLLVLLSLLLFVDR